MPYPYPRYMDGPDAESHIRAFLSTWQANRLTQRLTVAEVEASKLRSSHCLSMDPQLGGILATIRGNLRCFRMFALNSVNCFIARYLSGNNSASSTPLHKNRFQDLYRQVAQYVSANHVKLTFLAGLHEPLCRTLLLTNFSQQSIEQVVAHFRAIDRAQHNTSFSMGSLQNALSP